MTENTEVAVVKQQATKALNAANELVIDSPEGMTKAVDYLAKIKIVAKMIKERKEAITKPMMDALSSARELFKPIETNLADAEQITKKKMLAYQNELDEAAEKERARIAARVEKGTMKEETAVAKMEKIQDAPTSVQGKASAIATRIIKKFRITDESKLPREFLVPDMVKITAALRDGRDVPGAEVYTEKIIASSSKLDADSPLLGHKQK